MMQVNRYLENKSMDHIDHALGRPVNPLGETYRNYFYVVGDTELRQHMATSPNWQSGGKVTGGEYFSVTDEGRAALLAHLKEIGDQNRLWVVSYSGFDMEVVASTRGQARYRKWLDVSDTDDSLTFARFQQQSKVRAA